MSEAVVQRILLLLRIESSLKIKTHRTDKADLYLNRPAQMKSAGLNPHIESSSRASWRIPTFRKENSAAGTHKAMVEKCCGVDALSCCNCMLIQGGYGRD
jgi:hypothetical protein